MRAKLLPATLIAGLLAAPTALRAAQQAVPGKAKKPFDTRYLTRDFVLAFVANPRQILDSPPARDTFAELERYIGKEKVAKGMAAFRKQFGVAPRQVKQVVVLLDRAPVVALARTMPFAGGAPPGGGAAGGRPVPPNPILSFIVRFNGRVDRKAVTAAALQLLRESGMGLTRPSPDGPKNPLAGTSLHRHAGKQYRVLESMAICFVEDDTLLVSHESLLKRMIAARGVKSPLTGRLSSLAPGHDLVFALDMQPFAQVLAKFPPGIPPDVAKLFNYAKGLKTIGATADVSRETLLTAVAQSPDKAGATGLAKLLNNTFLPQIKAGWLRTRKLLPDNVKVVQFAAKVVDELLAGTRIVSAGSDVRLTIARPKALENLPKLVGPYVDEARKVARRSERMNTLRMIALAMHNYHDTHKRFPGNGSDASGKRKGLSWRVHLLPYIEQAALYQQFKLDEAWDSEHNKKLIAKMPKMYQTVGVKQKGRTSLHVFVGKGTPFGRTDGGPRLRDIVDGTSNTIMAVEAGPDKAEVWTKPGGLPFDPKQDPLKLLGKLPDDTFLAVFMDGRVRAINKNISRTVLKCLIQHADGLGPGF